MAIQNKKILLSFIFKVLELRPKKVLSITCKSCPITSLVLYAFSKEKRVLVREVYGYKPLFILVDI